MNSVYSPLSLFPFLFFLPFSFPFSSFSLLPFSLLPPSFLFLFSLLPSPFPFPIFSPLLNLVSGAVRLQTCLPPASHWLLPSTTTSGVTLRGAGGTSADPGLLPTGCCKVSDKNGGPGSWPPGRGPGGSAPWRRLQGGRAPLPREMLHF